MSDHAAALCPNTPPPTAAADARHRGGAALAPLTVAAIAKHDEDDAAVDANEHELPRTPSFQHLNGSFSLQVTPHTGPAYGSPHCAEDVTDGPSPVGSPGFNSPRCPRRGRYAHEPNERQLPNEHPEDDVPFGSVVGGLVSMMIENARRSPDGTPPSRKTNASVERQQLSPDGIVRNSTTEFPSMTKPPPGITPQAGA
jgi:hypothetical protein